MLDKQVLSVAQDEASAPEPRPTRVALHVVPDPAPESAAPQAPDYEAMSLPALCRVILDADAPRR